MSKKLEITITEDGGQIMAVIWEATTENKKVIDHFEFEFSERHKSAQSIVNAYGEDIQFSPRHRIVSTGRARKTASKIVRLVEHVKT